MSDDYDIGYGKPPRHTQWKSGRSGNPKGRPKRSRNFKSDVKNTLKEPVRLAKNGKPKTVSAQHAALLRLRERALQGEPRALDRLLELARRYNDDDLAENAARLDPTDEDILAAYRTRILCSTDTPTPANAHETEKKAAHTSQEKIKTSTEARKR